MEAAPAPASRRPGDGVRILARMRLRLRQLLFAMPLFTIPPTTATGAAGDGASASVDAFPLVTRRVQSWVDHGFYPGCSLWIAQGDRVLYERHFGANDADTPVYIASAGKWLGAAAMLAVTDDGALSLDDRAVKWLPEFGDAPKGRATLRQLFSHVSGYPPYQPEGRPTDAYPTTAESVAHLLPLPAPFLPGERFDYGGLAMQVAGRMAEVASGQDWETLFAEKIGRPLGFTGTRFTPVDPGHTPMIAGGAVSTLHDYTRFLAMIADGGVFAGRRILSERAVTEMLADQVRGARVKREEFVERVRGETHHGVYGLGVWREQLDAHGDAVVVSSPSWAGTYPWIDRRHDIRAVFVAHVDTGVANRAGFSGFWTSHVLMDMVRAELERATPRDLPSFEEGIIHAPGADLPYEAAGAGETVVLLHGHSFDRRMWDPQFADLAKSYRVIRYDLRGYGLADDPVEGRAFSHAGDLAALLDQLGIARAHVVGLSLGAFVAADFLALHPERLLSATLASGTVYTGPGSGEALHGERLAARLAEIEQTRAEGVATLKTRWREALLRGAGPRADALRPLLSAMIADWSAWQPLHVEPPHLLGASVLDRIRQAAPSAPVLWLAGANDHREESAARFRAVLPALRSVVIPDAGHLSNLEQPAAFTAALSDFLGSVTVANETR